jgi:hypothetical protein
MVVRRFGITECEGSTMNGADRAGASNLEIVAVYRSAASRHGRLMADSHADEAHDAAGVIAACYRELRRRGIEAQRDLLALLDDDDPSVRCWAGAHALEFAPDLGEPVLEELAAQTSLEAFDARMTLREWRRGSLSFP